MSIVLADPPDLKASVAPLDDPLAGLENPEWYEFVEGEPRERIMSMEATEISGCIIAEFRNWTKVHRLARVFGSEGQYQCFPHRPKQIRKPDVSVILCSRLPSGRLPKGYMKLAPDLAVEVVSPNDKADDIHARMIDFRLAGTPLVWVVYLETQRLYVHSAAGIRELGVEDTIDAEPVLPGFQARVADFFFREGE